MKRWRCLVSVGMLTLGVGAAYAIPALAVSDTFSQRILPMNCVFEVVNDGTGTLEYVTPAACDGIVNVTSNDISGSGPASITSIGTAHASSSGKIAPVGTPSPQLPWHPLVGTTGSPHSQSAPNGGISTPLVVGVSVGTLTVIVLAAFLL